MKITKENINLLPKNEQGLTKALLEDLDEINVIGFRTLYIDFQDYHNEYSPERVDPCPDFYGYYTIRDVENPSEILGVEMTIDDLDIALCLLYNYIIKE